MSKPPGSAWLRTGKEALAFMLEAIRQSQESIRLETYIYSASELGEQFRNSLIDASRRGVLVKVLVDAVGSISLPDSFWDPLRAAGGECRWFNPLRFKRWSYRDHRKVLVCDDKVAIIGGFNISPEYQGDGVEQGWRDLGLKVGGPLAKELAESFDAYFEQASFRRRNRRGLLLSQKTHLRGPGWQMLLTDSPQHRAQMRQSLASDIGAASQLDVICAYFLPTWRLRKQIMSVAQRGGRVRLILAGKSDVLLSQLAARRLYRAMLRAGVQIYEYEPQILHAKLYVADQTVYLGSANLDIRSLRINHELLVRFKSAELAEEAREIFSADLQYCRRIELTQWQSRSYLHRMRERIAYFFLVRVDPYLARLQLRI